MTNQPGNKMNRLTTLVALFFATTVGVAAQDLAESLRKGLFEEQANRDLNAAIEHYQDVIKAADAQRNIVATALYRLAESYRKQGKQDQAKELYERLAREYSDQTEIIAQLQTKEATDATSPSFSELVASDTLKRIERDRLKAELAIAEMKALHQALGEVPAEDLIWVLPTAYPDVTANGLLLTLWELEKELASLEIDHSSNHPAVVAKANSVKARRKQLFSRAEGALTGLSVTIGNKQDIAKHLQAEAQEAYEKLSSEGRVAALQRRISHLLDLRSSQSDSLELKFLHEELRELPRPELRKRLSTAYPDPQLNGLLQKLARLQSDYSQLTPDFSEDHPQVRQIRVQISKLEEQIEKKMDGMLKGIQILADSKNAAADAVKELLRATEAEYQQAVLQRTVGGQFTDLEKLLTNSPDLLNAPATNDLTFLQHAAKTGDTAMTEFLLQGGADPNIRSGNEASPLLLATANGHLKLAELLIQAGADLSAEYQSWGTPLHQAVRRGYTELTELLLRHKADANAPMRDLGDTPLHDAASRGRANLIPLLLKHGADLDAVNPVTGETALHAAIKNSRTDAALALLEAGADPNTPDSEGLTPLTEAIRRNMEEMAQKLLVQGADLNVRDAKGLSPLHYPSGAEFHPDRQARLSLPMTSLLLSAGADPDPLDSKGYTPLHHATMHTNLKVVSALLDSGADPNIQGADGFTPLHISAGGSVFLRTRQYSGTTQPRPSLEITELLLTANASPNLQTSDGKTPLHFAATPEIAKVLIKAGADPNAVAQDSFTPLDYNWNQPAVAEIIKAAGGTNSPQHSMPKSRSRTRNSTSALETSTPTLPGNPN